MEVNCQDSQAVIKTTKYISEKDSKTRNKSPHCAENQASASASSDVMRDKGMGLYED